MLLQAIADTDWETLERMAVSMPPLRKSSKWRNNRRRTITLE